MSSQGPHNEESMSSRAPHNVEVRVELDHPGAQQLLAGQALARLAYTGPDGFPWVIPIGFHWNGERIIVCTAPISP